MHHTGQSRPRLTRTFTALTAGTPLTLALSACAGGAENQIDLPPTSGVFDYQLGGSADHVEQDDESTQLDVVVHDAREEPLEGAYSICYVNGFQTQPEDAEFWHDHTDLLLWDGDEPATGPGWRQRSSDQASLWSETYKLIASDILRPPGGNRLGGTRNPRTHPSRPHPCAFAGSITSHCLRLPIGPGNLPLRTPN